MSRFVVKWLSVAFVGLLSSTVCAVAVSAQSVIQPAIVPVVQDPSEFRCDWTKPEQLPDWCLRLGNATGGTIDPVRGTTAGAVSGAIGTGSMAAASASTPFLPWPPPRPAHYIPLNKVSTAGTFGKVADRLATRLHARGYEDFLYYEVPGGFALTTELERFEDGGQPTGGSKRFQQGQLGGWGGFVDLLEKVFVGEDGRYRVFVFVVSSQPFNVADYPATAVDVERWGKAGSLTLDRSIASRRTNRDTRVTLLVYEFTEDHGRSATLMAIRRSIPRQAHLHWLGFDDDK